ncbi:MAG TPA: hypothetical protein VHN18_15615 [Micromonosporaceae bacterium]|nr:hypothetical protein [Micromonosporaceae bacterium]
MPESGTVWRVGGEMFSWSDWDPAQGPQVRGNALFYLLSELASAGRSVLVAGPHHDDVFTVLGGTGAAVSCVVRSLEDAERIARDYPDVTVYCGTIGKVDAPDGFDLIVAADGMDRLTSVEGDHRNADDLIEAMASLLSTHGVLALMHQNIFGLQHLVELEPGRHYRSDGAWYPVSEHDEVRPASLAELQERFQAHGLAAASAYAVFPAPRLASVFISQHVAGAVVSPLRGPLRSVLFSELTDAYWDTPVVQDPRPIVERAVRAGTESALAPAWLTLAHRAEATDVSIPRHDLVVGGADSFVYEFSADGRQLQRSVLAPSTRQEQRSGLRSVTDPGSARLDAGRLFEDHLLQLCAHHDLVGLRTALGDFAAWVESRSTDGAVTGPVALTSTYELVRTEGDFWPIPARWEPTSAVPTPVVLARALWGFAVRLITLNRPHPWHLAANAAELTFQLATTAGGTLTSDDLDAAIALEAACQTAERNLSPEHEPELRASLAAVGTGAAGIGIQGYREMADALWRQDYHLQQMEELVRWTERIIRSRDRALSFMDQELKLYQGTATQKVMLILRRVYRTLRRDARQIMNKVRRNRQKPIEMQ